jgi:hypothetical protein
MTYGHLATSHGRLSTYGHSKVTVAGTHMHVKDSAVTIRPTADEW